jgi:GDPmannose 4,6-dehydratase
VQIDPRYFRPTEVDVLLGDASKAHDKLGWTHTTPFRQLVSEMVAADLALADRERWRNDRSA